VRHGEMCRGLHLPESLEELERPPSEQERVETRNRVRCLMDLFRNRHNPVEVAGADAVEFELTRDVDGPSVAYQRQQGSTSTPMCRGRRELIVACTTWHRETWTDAPHGTRHE
jgi:hypothetical protein